MLSRKIRSASVALAIATLLGTLPPWAVSQTCCSAVLPTSETTQYNGCYEGGNCNGDTIYFGGLFYQTLYGPLSYVGSTVAEIPGTNQGENSCYFPGDIPGEYPTIYGPGGTSWPVTAGAEGAEGSWGADFVGMWDVDAQQIWELYAAGAIALPCHETTFQTMEIYCNQLPYQYEYNVLQSRVVNKDSTINTERATATSTALSPEIPLPPPQ